MLNSQQESCDKVHAAKLRVFAFGMQVFACEQCFSAQYIGNNFVLTNHCLRRLTIDFLLYLRPFLRSPLPE